MLEEKDVYVVDKEFKWTYVITHETGWCGPYFSQAGPLEIEHIDLQLYAGELLENGKRKN